VQNLKLDHVLRFLNNYFFCGALKGRVTAEWVDASSTELGWESRVIKRGDQAVIHIAGPIDPFWTDATVQGILNLLLSEMCYAPFLLWSCRCLSCRGHIREAWMRLVKTVEKEANRSLSGFRYPWWLKAVGAVGLPRKKRQRKQPEVEYLSNRRM